MFENIFYFFRISFENCFIFTLSFFNEFFMTPPSISSQCGVLCCGVVCFAVV